MFFKVTYVYMSLCRNPTFLSGRKWPYRARQRPSPHRASKATGSDRQITFGYWGFKFRYEFDSRILLSGKTG